MGDVNETDIQAGEEQEQNLEEQTDVGQEQEQGEQEEKEIDVKKLMEQVENLNKALREERENRKLLKTQLEQYQMLLQQQQQGSNEATDDLEEIDEDAYLTYGEWKRIYEKQRQRELEEQRRQQQQQMEFQVKLAQAEAEFKTAHPDYDDTIKVLQNVIKEDKELANYLMSDPLKAPERAYKIAKAFKLSAEKQTEMKETAELLQKQAKKPATQGVKSANVSTTVSERDAAEMSIQEYEEFIKNLSPEERRKITGLA